MKTIRQRVIELARERGTGVTVDTLIDVLDERDGDDELLEVNYETMTVEELRDVAERRGVELPTEGSGKDGAVLKADLVEALRS